MAYKKKLYSVCGKMNCNRMARYKVFGRQNELWGAFCKTCSDDMVEHVNQMEKEKDEQVVG
jgi:hypothetical protein